MGAEETPEADVSSTSLAIKSDLGRRPTGVSRELFAINQLRAGRPCAFK